MIEQVEQQLGNYRLKQLLGKGAFADVYLGEHLYLNTPVAVKVLHTQLHTSTLADFLTEARLVSQLRHPHIIRVFDFGLESDIPFLVMDYAPNGNLRQKHHAGSVLPLSTIVTYVKAIASALQYTHDRHLIHRDLKPENVLLGHKNELLLSDFGLAMLTQGREVLQVNKRFGTLPYMSPELIGGQAVAAGDQYALAVMVYEWLCGHLPFEGTIAYPSNQHLHTPPPPICEMHPDIPREVEQVVLKGLAREPTQRFVDVLSFSRTLEEVAQFVASPPAPTHTVALSSPDSQNAHYQNVPQPLTPLIGRERELQAAKELLLQQQVRILTLTGTGGIGKTHLALTLGNEMLEAFPQGVCYVSMDAIYDSELVIPAIVQALGLQEKSDSSPLHLLKTHLRDKHLLLVLDGFEQVLPSSSHLADVLRACAGIKILLTSRELLHIGGEYSFAVPPLVEPDLGQATELESLSQIASISLFVQRAQSVLPGFQLTTQNARDIAAICVRLEGVPLAIELAAEQSNVFPPRALLSRLERPLEILTGKRRDVPERHRTLVKTLDWNDAVLSADEQMLFRRLSVFVGGCSLHALEVVTMSLGGTTYPVLDGVRALTDKSLLSCTACWKDELRLSFMEITRLYALERLAECGEIEQMRDAHADYYLELAETAPDDSDHTAWQDWLQREVGNLRTALQWLLERKKGEEALRLAAALRQFWSLPEYLAEGRSFLERALEVSEESQIPVSRMIRARALNAAGWLAFLQHDHASATTLLEEGLRLSRCLGDARSEAFALTCLSSIFQDRGEKAVATSLLKAGVKLYGESVEDEEYLEREVAKYEEGASLTDLAESQSAFPARAAEPLLPRAYEELTSRESEVLRLLTIGLSNKQIAERLVISPHTVNGHIHSIFGKLAVNSRSAATRYALEYQLA